MEKKNDKQKNDKGNELEKKDKTNDKDMTTTMTTEKERQRKITTMINYVYTYYIHILISSNIHIWPHIQWLKKKNDSSIPMLYGGSP